jgi:hypothetical protein
VTGACDHHPPPVPGPCVRAGSGVYFTCPSYASYSDPPPDASGVAPAFCDCLPSKPVGAECTRVEECDTKHCDADHGLPHRCAEPKETGSACYSNLECASRDCGAGTPGRCVACE